VQGLLVSRLHGFKKQDSTDVRCCRRKEFVWRFLTCVHCALEPKTLEVDVIVNAESSAVCVPALGA
jgi:hypothetical protein